MNRSGRPNRYHHDNLICHKQLYRFKSSLVISKLTNFGAFIPFRANYCLVYDLPISTCVANASLLLIEEFAACTRFSRTRINTLLYIKITLAPTLVPLVLLCQRLRYVLVCNAMRLVEACNQHMLKCNLCVKSKHALCALLRRFAMI